MVNQSYRDRACTGKTKHATMKAALVQAEKGKRYSYGDSAKRLKISAYRCDFCGFYHVGRSRKGKGSKEL